MSDGAGEGYSGETWLPRFLREAGVRRGLTALYVGLIGSTENAHSLLDNDVDDIKPETAHGNPITAYCFRFSIRWLRYLKEFSLAEKVFLETFLEPARTAAKFIVAAREEAPYSISLHGLLFLKSPPFYDKAFGDNMCILALMIPELSTVLTIRCRKEQVENVAYGDCYIHGIQPIPFVNRAHPTRIEIQMLQKTTNPLEMDFCKLSFKDVGKFTRLTSFENFVELYSEQIYDINKPQHGRRLGHLAVLGGRIVSAGSGPYITIQDPCSSQSMTCTFFVSQNVLKSHNMDLLELQELTGKQARVMAIFWYRYGSIKFTSPYPEIISLDIVKNESNLIEDDLVGFVRLRGKTDLKTLGERYKLTDLSLLPKSLVFKDGKVAYNSSVSEKNRIGKLFLEQAAKMKLIREQAIFEMTSGQEIEPFVTPEQVLNTERLELKGMAEWILANKPLFSCLLAFIMTRDLNGELPTSFKEFIATNPKYSSFFSAESFLWLKNLDLIRTRKGKTIQVTERGLSVAYLAAERLLVTPLKKIFSQEGFVDFIGLEAKIPAPPSILLKTLRQLVEKKVITHAVFDGAKCELLWFPCGAGETNQINSLVTERVKSLQNQVIAVLNSIHYPLRTIAVLQRMREKGQSMNYPGILILLSTLAAQKRITKDESDFWFYPLKARVIDVLKENPLETFTIEEIAIRASLAPMSMHLTTLNIILVELKKDQQVQEVTHGEWLLTLSENEDQRKQILLTSCRKRVLRLLESSQVGQDELVHDVVSFASSLKTILKTSETSLQIANEVIGKMFEKGEIARTGSFVRIRHSH